MSKIPISKEDPIGFNSSNVVHTFSASSKSWVATEDCYVGGYLYYSASMGADNAYVTVAGVPVAYAGGVKIGGTYYDAVGTACAPVRKGQTVLVNSNNYTYLKCYGK